MGRYPMWIPGGGREGNYGSHMNFAMRAEGSRLG